MAAVIIHPGILLADELLSLKISTSVAAAMLDLREDTLASVLKGEQAFTPAIAEVVAKLTSTEAEFWMGLQTSFDLASSNARATALQRPPSTPIA